MSPERKVVRVRDVMKAKFDMVDGKMTIMDALRTMKHVETKSLIVDKRNENDEYGILLISDIAKNVLAKNKGKEGTQIMANTLNILRERLRAAGTVGITDAFAYQVLNYCQQMVNSVRL